jgi:hypothetical protein
MMVAAIIVGREWTLAIDGPAELATPDDECVLEQAPLFEVPNERGLAVWLLGCGIR